MKIKKTAILIFLAWIILIVISFLWKRRIAVFKTGVAVKISTKNKKMHYKRLLIQLSVQV